MKKAIPYSSLLNYDWNRVLWSDETKTELGQAHYHLVC